MDLNAEIIREHSKAVALRLRVAPAFGMSCRTAIVWAAGPGAVLPVEKFLDIVCAFHPNQYAFIREAHDLARTRIIAELLRERLTDVLPTESIENEPPMSLLMAQLQDVADEDEEAASPRTALFAPPTMSR
jgi:hypothetical protein